MIEIVRSCGANPVQVAPTGRSTPCTPNGSPCAIFDDEAGRAKLPGGRRLLPILEKLPSIAVKSRPRSRWGRSAYVGVL